MPPINPAARRADPAAASRRLQLCCWSPRARPAAAQIATRAARVPARHPSPSAEASAPAEVRQASPSASASPSAFVCRPDDGVLPRSLSYGILNWTVTDAVITNQDPKTYVADVEGEPTDEDVADRRLRDPQRQHRTSASSRRRPGSSPSSRMAPSSRARISSGRALGRNRLGREPLHLRGARRHRRSTASCSGSRIPIASRRSTWR